MALFVFQARHFYAIPNAVSLMFFGIEKPKLGAKVVFSALIGPHKGFEDLLQAASRLQAEGVEPAIQDRRQT